MRITTQFRVIKTLAILSLLFFYGPVAAQKNTQNRDGVLDYLDSGLCESANASAKVHENGARITVRAHGCTAGHVMTVWGFAVDDSEFIILNCGGGIVLPNGQFATICDVPRGDIAECQDCAQVLVGGVIGEPRNMDFAIEMLTHHELDPATSLSQIRTVNTCGPDACETVAFLIFPAP